MLAAEWANEAKAMGRMAGPTRLELATSGVTGRRSNQLNYDPASYGGVRAAPSPRRLEAEPVRAAPTCPLSPEAAAGRRNVRASDGWWAVQGSNL